MEDKLKEIMSKLFKVSKEDISEASSQTTVEKWDSLNQLNLVVEIEDAFDISLEPEDISKMIDFNSVIEVIKHTQND